MGHGHFRFAPHGFDQITAENGRAGARPFGHRPRDWPIPESRHGDRATNFAKQFFTGSGLGALIRSVQKLESVGGCHDETDYTGESWMLQAGR